MTNKNLIKRKGVNNADVRKYVDKMLNFETNNKTIFGVNGTKHYVVYSYEYHYPMYVYDYEADKWLGNKDKPSKTTQGHKSLARPTIGIHQWYDSNMLIKIQRHGYLGCITLRLEGETI